MRRELVCTGAGHAAAAGRCGRARCRVPQAGQVLVRVEATSVNPIDVKRAAGYGRRLLGLKGAAQLSARARQRRCGHGRSRRRGRVALCAGATCLRPAGDRQGGRRARIARRGAAGAARWPRRQTSTWRRSRSCRTRSRRCGSRVRSTGLTSAQRAQACRVLVNGASGGLGRLALQLLHRWGSRVTAICGPGKREDCLALGAVRALERGSGSIASLPADFDVVLELRLLGRRVASGVAPGPRCTGSCDDRASAARELRPARLAARRARPAGASSKRMRISGWQHERSNARYRWTLFKPDREALETLAAALRERRFSLPVGICARLGARECSIRPRGRGQARSCGPVAVRCHA